MSSGSVNNQNQNQQQQPQAAAARQIAQHQYFLLTEMKKLRRNTFRSTSQKDQQLLPILQTALRAGADVNLKVPDFWSFGLVPYFAHNAMIHCFKECLSPHHSADIVLSDSDILFLCPVTNGGEVIVGELIDLFFDHPNAGTSLNAEVCVRLAVECGFTNGPRTMIVEKLLRKFPHAASTAMYHGVRFRNLEVIRLARRFGHGMDVAEVFVNDDTETLQALLDNRKLQLECKHGPSDDTAFLLAVRYGNVKCVNLLISRGCNVDAKNRNGDGAVELAIVNNRAEVFKILKGKTDLVELASIDRYKRLVQYTCVYGEVNAH